jgi:hypothetical protein
MDGDLIYLQLKLLMLSGAGDVNRKAATVMTETELVAKEEVGSLGIIKVRLEQNMPLVLLTQMKLEFKI